MIPKIFLRNTFLILLLLMGFFPWFLSLKILPGTDEALLTYQSWLITKGGLPYRDYFQFITPITLYFGSLLYQAFGFTIVGTRLLVSLVYLANVIACDFILKPYFKPITRYFFFLWFIGGVLPSIVAYSHHAWSGAFATWAILSVIMYHRTRQKNKPQKNWLLLSGALVGLTLMSTQSLGGLLLITLLAGLWVYGIKAQKWTVKEAFQEIATSYLLGFTVINLIFIGVMAYQGILNDFYEDTVLWLLAGHYSKTTSFMYYFPGGKEVLQMLVNILPDKTYTLSWAGIPVALFLTLMGWLPVLGLLWSGETLVRKIKLGMKQFEPKDWELFLLTVGGGTLFISTWSYSLPWHVGMVGWLNYGISFIAIQAIVKRFFSKPFRVSLNVVVIISAIYLTGLKSFSLWNAHQIPQFWVASHGTTEPYFLDSGGPASAQHYNQTVKLIRKESAQEDLLYVFNAKPEFYFLANRSPATGFYITLPVYTSQDQIQKIIESLKKNQPEIILYDGGDRRRIQMDDRFRHYQQELKQLDPIWAYVLKHYTLKQNGRFAIFKKIK